MKVAFSLARRGLGNVWPNPAVGCIIVKNGRIVGRGWTQPGGRPHAESMALKQAGKKAAGSTAYVNLEPCNHTGKSPPCTEALIEAGIKEIFGSLLDPDPRVSGTGFERLKKADLQVNIGLLSETAREINEGFFLRINEGRPFLTFKTATTIDGKIATKNGESNGITGKEARSFTHLLRSTHDATLVGSGTALADNPDLTSRLPGIDNTRRPRIILDRGLRLPLDSRLAMSAKEAPVWLITRNDHPPSKLQSYKDLYIDLILMPPGDTGQSDIVSAMQQLGSRGLTRILVEGGNHVASSFFAADLIDQLVWFRAPKLLGNGALSAIGNLNIDKLSEMPDFVRQSSTNIGKDFLEILSRNR